MFRRNPRTGAAADVLVVGLGNPGEEYDKTRHNVGAEVVEILARRHGGKLRKQKERSLTDEVNVGGKRVGLAIPLTYMNLSGEAVAPLMRRYGVEPGQLVVVQDEMDFELGRLQVKNGGGLAGHNGLKSLKAHLGGPDFTRVRIGVGRPDSTDPEIVSRHVLSRFDEPAADVRTLVERAAGETERLLRSRTASQAR